MTQIDISGQVDGRNWSDLPPFTQGYIKALLASSQLNKIGKKLGAFMGVAGFSDLAPETLARIIADCEDHRRAFSLEDQRAMGRKFWFERQDGDFFTYPIMTVHLGSDGKVRFA